MVSSIARPPSCSSTPALGMARDCYSTLTGTLRYETPFASAGGRLPARMLTCTEGVISTGIASVLSRAVLMVTNSSSLMPSCRCLFDERSSATVVRAGVSAREVGPGASHVRHEDSVAHEDGVANVI